MYIYTYIHLSIFSQGKLNFTHGNQHSQQAAKDEMMKAAKRFKTQERQRNQVGKEKSLTKKI